MRYKKKNKKDLNSPYWEWVETHNGVEDKQANPNSILENEGIYYQDKEQIEIIKEKAQKFLDKFYLLSPQEKRIIELYMKGNSQYKIARNLHISRNSVKEFMLRTREKLNG